MSEKVYVTGLGIISSIGNNVDETLISLKNLRQGIGTIKYLDSRHKNIIPVCEIKFSDEELVKIANVPHNKKYTRTALLGIIAAKQAVINSQILNDSHWRTGLISGTTVGGMGRTELYYNKYIDFNIFGDFLGYIETHDCGESTERIAEFLKIKDYVTTISTACSSSANAIMFGARLIKNNILDRVIVGGTESLTKFTLNGFNTLMILDKESCKPFDENRSGLNLGEGAAYIVIESEKCIKSSEKEIFCELSGYANANDAFHQTASSPDGLGAYLAMKNALYKSELSTTDIDYINVHGTGTPNNDLSEGKAIQRLFSPDIPKFSSTKPYTGHTLGACGAIEAIFSILAIKHRIIYPNLNFENPINELGFSPVKKIIKDVEIRNVMSNSFGFGGNNTSLIFSKC